MLDLSNPGKLPLKDLPEDIAVGMFIAWRNGAAVEFWRWGRWLVTDAPLWLRINVYRIHPSIAKQLIAPWEWLAPWIKAVAMDSNFVIFGYASVPTQGKLAWVKQGGNMECLSHLIKFDTAEIDWRNSLITRPEGK